MISGANLEYNEQKNRIKYYTFQSKEFRKSFNIKLLCCKQRVIQQPLQFHQQQRFLQWHTQKIRLVVLQGVLPCSPHPHPLIPQLHRILNHIQGVYIQCVPVIFLFCNLSMQDKCYFTKEIQHHDSLMPCLHETHLSEVNLPLSVT